MDDEFSSVEPSDLAWARDVLTVYQNLGTIAGRRKLKTSSAKALNEWVHETADNKGEFLKNFVPKATDILHKLQPNTKNEELIRFEKRSIAELQGLLAETLSG